MQDMTPEACSQAPLNTQKTLTDIRDGNTYTIARIKNQTNDNALCWMTQNLRLVKSMVLTPEDSDVISSDYVLPSPVVLDKTNDNPKLFSVDDQYVSRVYYANNTSYGAYYNWFTSTAGTGTANTMSGNAESSICPRGWRLPTGNNDGDFYNLLSGLAITSIIRDPYFFTYGGRTYNSTLNYTDSDGRYWSSTLSNNATVYYLSFTTGSSIDLSYATTREFGFSVRCVAR